MRRLPRKDPGDILDYTFDYSDELKSGETLDTVSAFTILPPSGSAGAGDITEEVAAAIDGTATSVVVWLEGGNAGTVYTVHTSLLTTGVTPVRTIDRDWFLLVEDHYVGLPPKDPSDVSHFTLDATDGLATGEEIASRTVTPESGISAAGTGSAISSDGLSLEVFISGGTSGTVYDVDTTIVTDASPQARTFHRIFRLPVRDL